MRGDTVELFPAHLEDRAWRISLFGDEIESITEFDPLTGQKTDELKLVKVYANSHYVTPKPTLQQAIKSIKAELKQRLDELYNAGKLLEAQRLEQRTVFDMEMMEATGSCAGIENYSRYLTGRKPGEPPPTLFEYLPDNALVFVDESHVTVPQIGGMFRGDYRRKATLAEYGFRLPSCMDNRPLRFEEWDAMRPQTVYVSATPGGWELEQTGGAFVEQVIRPTGLIDPPVEIRPAKTAGRRPARRGAPGGASKGYRTLVTTLTKRMAEDLTEYMHEQRHPRALHALRHRDAGAHRDHPRPAARRLRRADRHQPAARGPRHSRVRAGRHPRRRQGRLPALARPSLIQTIGRAARNVDGKVILYADQMTGSMERAIAETDRRREKQMAYNTANGITPESIKRNIHDVHVVASTSRTTSPSTPASPRTATPLVGHNLAAVIEDMEKRCARPPPTSSSRPRRACATRSSACARPSWPSPTIPLARQTRRRGPRRRLRGRAQVRRRADQLPLPALHGERVRGEGRQQAPRPAAAPHPNPLPVKDGERGHAARTSRRSTRWAPTPSGACRWKRPDPHGPSRCRAPPRRSTAAAGRKRRGGRGLELVDATNRSPLYRPAGVIYRP